MWGVGVISMITRGVESETVHVVYTQSWEENERVIIPLGKGVGAQRRSLAENMCIGALLETWYRKRRVCFCGFFWGWD